MPERTEIDPCAASAARGEGDSSTREITILGSTGSIGASALSVVAMHPDRYRIRTLTAHSRIDVLLHQCVEHRPRDVVVVDRRAAAELRGQLAGRGLGTRVHAGAEAVAEVAGDPGTDIVIAAIVGAAGLLSTLAAVSAGHRVLLANKEPLVMLGGSIVALARARGAELLPLDSEHNAIFQCLPHNGSEVGRWRAGDRPKGVRRVVLTASGGPFLGRDPATLRSVTPVDACTHPNWNMGRKISVDSATMMNKGLEVIEACRLFDFREDEVDAVIHPQSIVHSLVEYVDGSVLAQMASPDMRVPIANALAWPDRIDSGARRLDLLAAGRLEFQELDPARFPCMSLARAAVRQGGTAPAVLNAANEVAVEAFLERRLAFPDIAGVIESTLESVDESDVSLESVLEADRVARERAGARIGTIPPHWRVAGAVSATGAGSGAA